MRFLREVSLELHLGANCLPRCPVCGQDLLALGMPDEQEAHVKGCLEGGAGASNQAAKYLVYKLPAESVLVGTECVICLEDFTKGMTINYRALMP